MLEPVLSTIRSSYSGASARNFIADISRFHRIQASPGLRAATAYLHDLAQSFGLRSELLSFPATFDSWSWTYQHHQEWECTSATLDLIEPSGESRRLADFRVDPLSVIQRSAPFTGELEVVVLEDGSKPEDYEHFDVRGKLVFFSKPLEAVRELAVEKHGAAGLLTDWMSESAVRPYMNLPDALQYTSFWWRGPERKVFGFVLSPGEGRRLRALVSEGRSLKVRVKVDSRLHDGAFEAVTALLEGETDETVVMVGHICHPAPGANDNASGAAATLEAARCLQSLVDAGELPRPKRSIRFLWVPEMLGSYSYLATHEQEIEKMIAGVNLDMVGEDQTLCGSSFLIDLPPEAMASFTGDLMEAIRDAVATDTPSFSGQGRYASFRHATTPFGGGSDHIIFNDPSVGVPMPMLIEWPDRFYHTSADSLDKVDPRMLGVIGSVATTYAYWIANAGDREARWLSELMLAKAKKRVVDVALARTQDTEQDLADAITYRVGREQAAFETLKRLASHLDISLWAGEIEDFAKRELTRVRPDVVPAASPPADVQEDVSDAAGLVPVRTSRGPINVGHHLRKLDEARRRELEKLSADGRGRLSRTAAYWADGKRTLGEIASLAAMECGIDDLAYLTRYFRFLEEMGLIELIGG